MPRKTTNTKQDNDEAVNEPENVVADEQHDELETGQNGEQEQEQAQEHPRMSPAEFEIARFTIKATQQKDKTSIYTCFPRYLYDDVPLNPDNLENKSKSILLITKPIKMN